MKQHLFKEVASVYYGENLIKVLHFHNKRIGDICFKQHYHDRMELLRIRQGRIALEIDDAHFEAQAGDLVIINPNQAHVGIVTEGGLDYDVIMFDLVNLNANSAAYLKHFDPIIKQQISFVNKTDHPDIIAIADSLVRSDSEKATVHPLYTIGLIYSILGAFYQHCTISERPVGKHIGFNEITAYIDAHFTEPISNKSLSEMFGYNEAYFSRMFKKNSDLSLSRHIQALRIRHAQKLLHTTDDSIAAIAIQCGYSDVFYFSNRFKLHTGKTPREYRTLSRNQEGSE